MALSAAPLSAYGEELYQEVLPLHGPDPELTAYAYIGALASMMEPVDELIRDTEDEPGWSLLFDLDRLVATENMAGLYWLAQARGVVLRAPLLGEATATWVAYAETAIRERPAEARGRPAYIISAVQETLTGNRSVSLVERDGSAWRLTIITRTAETPDAAATLAAAYAATPAGIVITHTVSDAVVWSEATRTWNATTATWNAAVLADVT